MPAFDTLQATKLLKESGFGEAQAEAVVITVRDAIAENVATKADIAEASTALRADIAEVKAEVAELRNSTKAEIARWEEPRVEKG